jgi:hypothetical protein
MLINEQRIGEPERSEWGIISGFKPTFALGGGEKNREILSQDGPRTEVRVWNVKDTQLGLQPQPAYHTAARLSQTTI